MLNSSGSALSRFLTKSPGDKKAAVIATLRHHYRRLAGRPTRWQDDGKLRRSIAGPMTLPQVLHSDSRTYIAWRPDADIDFDHLPELRDLAPQWISGNAFYGAGDLPRLYALSMNVRQVLSEGIQGSFAELGVYRGNSAAVLAHYARSAGRRLFLFDTFAGFDSRDLRGVDENMEAAFGDTSMELVRRTVGDGATTYVKGYFPQSMTAEAAAEAYAVVHLDCDLYEPMRAAIAFFYARLAPGGLIIVHDYANPCWVGVKQAIDEFMATVPEQLVVIPDKCGTAMIRRCAL
jgi:hypothetical protein